MFTLVPIIIAVIGLLVGGQLTHQGTRFKGFQRDGAPPQAR